MTLYLSTWVLSKDDGTDAMRKVSDPIREGAEGFLRVQYTAIGKVASGLAAAIFLSYLLRGESAHDTGLSRVGNFTLGLISSFTFLLGAFCSALAGYVSMWVSAQTNIRVCSAAGRTYSESFDICFRGGAFSAILALTMCVTGVTFVYIFAYIFFALPGTIETADIPLLMVGYGFGASFVALFMQLGGGIYTKAADVGADLVGKVEIGIPEDDPRNPAVIADLVGDMVGDCVGSSADVFESVAAEIIGAMILGAALAKEANLENPVRFVFFPVVIHAFDIIVSSCGILSVKVPPKDDEDAAMGKDVNPMTPLKRGYIISSCLAFCGFAFATRTLLYVESAPTAWMNYTACGLVGMITSYIFILTTQYYTDYAYPPVREIAQASTTGHGTNIITGVAIGFKSVVVPSVTVSAAVLTAYHLGSSSGLGQGHNAGLFGTAVATMGLLSSAAYILAQNNFGPVADNAGGIAEMSGCPEHVRNTTDKLDAAGNVTKAITKGYSVGSAALACFLLFGAFMDEINNLTSTPFTSIDLATPEVVVGGLLGVTEIFLLVGMSIAAVGKTAGEVVKEVRRQLKENPEILQWTAKPNYKACVEIVTKAALKEMQLPGIIAVAMPTLVGIIFRMVGSQTGRPQLGAEVIGAYMMMATVTGILMALFLDNVGGAWDNAKKYVELGNFGGKGSEAHKAAVTGDTVGDPFKDTAGPAIHVVIKLLSNTVLVLSPLFIGAAATVR
eukprot:CAMPEP_0184014398 /NCGR_PEP_ID=MMETSP0954-20121128/5628_1 /TAXON_ID=627963 /ORGANISM="Aplanochytrium sp, Strain PBS07" /LENGTH=728 /DNA_ID=CAMNT_0026294857 /DNA_START=561 /DNA_END=2747 /DNA_ORIENTATION=-